MIWRETIHGKRTVVKVYRNRGFFASLRAPGSPYRAQREYETLKRMQDAGIDCTPPLLWSHGSGQGMGRYEVLVTEELEGVEPVRELSVRHPDETRHLNFGRLYEQVRVLHRVGIRHGALSIKNVLVRGRGDDARFYFVDLSRAILFPGDLFGSRMAWFDLLDLSVKLAALYRSDFCAPLLSRYGLSDREVERMLGSLRHYKATRHTRNRLRLEFSLRAWWSRHLGGTS